MRSHQHTIAGLTAAAFLLRGVAHRSCTVVTRDAVGYLDAAQRFADGDVVAGATGHLPPLYPLVLALLCPAGALESSAPWVTIALSSLLVPAAAACCPDPRSGRWAALLAATLAPLISAGSVVLADGLFLVLLVATLASVRLAAQGRHAGWAAVVGALSVAAYLTRPEGLVVFAGASLVLAWTATSAGRRLRLAGAALVPGALLFVPYLLWIRDYPTLGGEGAGAFKLTLKRNLGHVLGAYSVPLGLGRVFDQARVTIEGLALGLVPLLGGAVAWRGATPATRRAAGAGLWVAGALLVAYSVIRADRRYVAPLVVCLLPLAGWGATYWTRAAGRRRRAVFALALAAWGAGSALRTQHADKLTYRLAGARLQGVARVLSHDSRVAYYAGAQHLPFLSRYPQREPNALELYDWAREADASVVVRVDTPDRVRRAEALAAYSERQPVPVTAPGAIPLAVFDLRRR